MTANAASAVIRKLYSMDTIDAEYVRKNFSTEFDVCRLTHTGYVQPTCLQGLEAVKRLEAVIDRILASRRESKRK